MGLKKIGLSCVIGGGILLNGSVEASDSCDNSSTECISFVEQVKLKLRGENFRNLKFILDVPYEWPVKNTDINLFPMLDDKEIIHTADFSLDTFYALAGTRDVNSIYALYIDSSNNLTCHIGIGRGVIRDDIIDMGYLKYHNAFQYADNKFIPHDIFLEERGRVPSANIDVWRDMYSIKICDLLLEELTTKIKNL